MSVADGVILGLALLAVVLFTAVKVKNFTKRKKNPQDSPSCSGCCAQCRYKECLGTDLRENTAESTKNQGK